MPKIFNNPTILLTSTCFNYNPNFPETVFGLFQEIISLKSTAPLGRYKSPLLYMNLQFRSRFWFKVYGSFFKQCPDNFQIVLRRFSSKKMYV